MAIDTNIALLSLAETKQFLKIADATTGDDDIVGDILNGVSDWVNRYCGRTFLTGTLTEYYDGDGSSSLQLKNFPVTSITTIHQDESGARNFNAADLIAATDYFLEGGPGIVHLFNNRSAFLCGNQNVKVVYVAGYALAAIPFAVQLAAKELCSLIYRNTYQQWRLGIASEQIGDRNISLRDEEIPRVIKSMLDPYRVMGA